MELKNNDCSPAQKAAELQEKLARQKANNDERQMHAMIMQQLRQVRGYMAREYGDYCADNVWKEEKLSPEVMQLILDRGHFDEIMELIHHYGTAAPEGVHYGKPSFILLPEEVEVYIVRRNISAEIREFARYHGFAAAGQDAMLQYTASRTMLEYLKCHGFLPEQQRKLLAQGVESYIRTHIRHHGLAEEVISEIIDDLKEDKTDNFYHFIAEREIPVSQQKHLLEVMKEREFYFYIERYGFWEEVLPDLVRLRSEEELKAYICRHRYLGNGISTLVEHHSPELHLYYAKNLATGTKEFLELMLKVRPIDYRCLSVLFNNLMLSSNVSEDQMRAIDLFYYASHEDVMAFLTQEKPQLCLTALAALFWRNIPEEFETYLNLH